MKIIRGVYKTIDTINDWIGRICSFLVLGILGVIIVEVILRRIFNNPQIWTMDAICMTFGCYIILICAYGFQKKAFVAVDILYARLPKIAQHSLHIITYLCFFVPFVVCLIPTSFNFFYKSFCTGEKGYSVWAPPVWPVKLCLAIGLVLLCMQGVSEILKHIEGIGECIKEKKTIIDESEDPVSEIVDAIQEQIEEKADMLEETPDESYGEGIIITEGILGEAPISKEEV